MIDIPKMMLPLRPEKFMPLRPSKHNNSYYSTTTTLFQYSRVSTWYYLHVHYSFNYSTIQKVHHTYLARTMFFHCWQHCQGQRKQSKIYLWHFPLGLKSPCTWSNCSIWLKKDNKYCYSTKLQRYYKQRKRILVYYHLEG